MQLTSKYELLQVTLLGLWLVPAVASFYFHFWLFLVVSFIGASYKHLESGFQTGTSSDGRKEDRSLCTSFAQH